MREALTDAIRYWELRRLLYNGLLAGIVITYYVLGLPASTGRLTADLAQGVFLLAVLANVAYCAAYVADLAAQMSGFHDVWIKLRWALLVIGMLFAGIITRYFSMGFFSAT